MNLEDLVIKIEETSNLYMALDRSRKDLKVYPFDSSVGNIYDACKAIMEKKGRRISDAWERKKFIFVSLCLLSPLTLVGARLRPGLRGKMARLINCRPTSISHDIRLLLFFYKAYSDFRDDVQEYYLASVRALPNSARVLNLPEELNLKNV